jgi:hypothetical protein
MIDGLKAAVQCVLSLLERLLTRTNNGIVCSLDSPAVTELWRTKKLERSLDLRGWIVVLI